MYKKIILLILILVSPSLLLAQTQTSYTVSVSAMVLSNSTSGNIDNGNSGVVLTEMPTILNLSGYTSPDSSVFISINETQVKEIFSDVTGGFQFTINTLRPGNYNIGIKSTDINNFTSKTLTMQIELLGKKITAIENIFIAPTIGMLTKDSNYVIAGSTMPYSLVTLYSDDLKSLDLKTNSDSLGNYYFLLDSRFNDYIGKYIKSSSYQNIKGIYSEYSLALYLSPDYFTIKNDTQPTNNGYCLSRADLNYDCLANFMDFNILVYWYRKNMAPQTIDLNHDGVVDMSDFSILAHYWN